MNEAIDARPVRAAVRRQASAEDERSRLPEGPANVLRIAQPQRRSRPVRAGRRVSHHVRAYLRRLFLPDVARIRRGRFRARPAELRGDLPRHRDAGLLSPARQRGDARRCCRRLPASHMRAADGLYLPGPTMPRRRPVVAMHRSTEFLRSSVAIPPSRHDTEPNR